MDYLDIAAKMLGLKNATDVPAELAVRLRRIDQLIQRAPMPRDQYCHPISLRSRQNIAQVIEQWEREQES